ncbi:ATP synthase F1 subunit epsilon [Candidatus Peribacteria bacterium]|nr:MAG: ATP synthase F1 subunit epsilon [Candidatus Peribacteria bacterium]
MRVELITPEGTSYSGDAVSVTVPSGMGEITILENHIPLMSNVMPGTVIVRKDGEELYFAVARGVVQVEKHGLMILADGADRTDALEESAIEIAKKRAEELRNERRNDEEAFADATALLEREIAKLASLRRLRSRRRSI